MGTALSFAKQKVVWNVQWGGVVKKKKVCTTAEAAACKVPPAHLD